MILAKSYEKIYDIIELICGARFTTSYTRIGGLSNDISDEAIAKLKRGDAWGPPLFIICFLVMYRVPSKRQPVRC